MKSYIFTTFFILVLPCFTFAIFVSDFTSWDDLTDNSPEIVIARCVATQDFVSASNQVTITVDGMINSEIEILKVLKGSPCTGTVKFASEYKLYRGQYFVMFTNCKKDEFNSGYTAVENYRVIPLGSGYNQFVWDHYLAGKPLKEQIHFILNSRLKNLNDEIRRDNEEKSRLEQELNRDSNAPPAVIPHGATNARLF